jgi:hypothetical protein
LRALFACESGLSEPEIGARVRSFDLAIISNKRSTTNGKINSHGARFQKQLQTALILSATFI